MSLRVFEVVDGPAEVLRPLNHHVPIRAAARGRRSREAAFVSALINRIDDGASALDQKIEVQRHGERVARTEVERIGDRTR